MRRKRSVQHQTLALPHTMYNSAHFMRGVYSIPAVIEVCAMKRICMYHMATPCSLKKLDKIQCQKIFSPSGVNAPQNPGNVQHMEITPFDIAKGEGAHDVRSSRSTYPSSPLSTALYDIWSTECRILYCWRQHTTYVVEQTKTR